MFDERPKGEAASIGEEAPETATTPYLFQFSENLPTAFNAINVLLPFSDSDTCSKINPLNQCAEDHHTQFLSALNA